MKILKIPDGPSAYDIPPVGCQDGGRLVNDLVACTKLHDAAEIPRRAAG